MAGAAEPAGLGMELDLALDREGVTLQPSESGDLLDETAWLQQLQAPLRGKKRRFGCSRGFAVEGTSGERSMRSDLKSSSRF